MQTASLLSVAAAVILAAAQVPHTPPPAPHKADDEAAIRRLIAQRDAGTPIPSTPDRIFWAASFQKPIIGDEAPTLRTHDRGVENRVDGTTRNTSTVRRLVIAESGDMAYEYSDGTVSFDLKTGEHVVTPNSTLRVWQKVDGHWTAAATFTITHYRD
jgi:hypothetical protein